MSLTPTSGDESLSIGRGVARDNPRTAIILGGARCLWEDLKAAESLFTPDIFIATNHAGVNFERPFDFWVSFHPEKFPEWIERRRKWGHPLPPMLVTARHRQSLAAVKRDFGIPMKFIDSWGGSSGLLSVTLALGLGCRKIVLAGVPLDKYEAHFDAPQPWSEASKYRSAWMGHIDEMKNRVRGWSGWTAQQLGVVTEEWLAT
jgi:hypothetical protein